MNQSATANVPRRRESKRLVFVVDDEPLLLELAASLLESSGYDVQTFRDPEDAVSAFAAAKPSPALIITDYAMHQMNGLDLIRKCRQICPGQKTMLVSGTVDESIYRQSTCQPDCFLAKPYQGKELIRLAQSVLGD